MKYFPILVAPAQKTSPKNLQRLRNHRGSKSPSNDFYADVNAPYPDGIREKNGRNANANVILNANDKRIFLNLMNRCDNYILANL